MRVLLVEPYYTGSHQAWADGYVAHSRHEVRLVTHPGRSWKWRMRGGAVTLAASLEHLQGWIPEVVIVSDMIDLGHFRTLARPFIGDPPTAIYFHETQLTYPDPPKAHADDSYALTNWISAYSADRILFNSDFHRDVFYDSLPDLLRKFPDLRHDGLIADAKRRTEVLPVGIDLSWVSQLPRDTVTGNPRILWNHRWEYDKDPDAFADAVEHLVGAGADFELVLAGPRSNRAPAALRRIREKAGGHIVHDGDTPMSLYRKLLAESDIVVSAARQEFFGISVVEAVAAGCRPVLPNRLSYPWLIPDEYHDEVLYEEGALGSALLEALETPRAPQDLAATMKRFSWDTLAPAYDALLARLTRVEP